MSTIVQTSSYPMSIYFNSGPPPSILLNGGPRHQRVYRPHEKYATTKSLPPNYNDRKIRFAPLPDPRNATLEDDKTSNSQTNLSSLSYSNSSNHHLARSVPSTAAGSTQSDETDRDDASLTRRNNSNKKAFLKNLLSVNTKTAPIIQDATSSLGLSLFRSGSRDSNSSSDDVNSATDINSLSKRERKGSNDKKSSRSGSPFHTRMSMSGPASASASLGGGLPIPSPRSRNQPLRPTISAPSVGESPIRLLNGRVYGSKGSQQQKKDWSEPEFVEWGYGGMGSVKSGEAFYGGVQAGGDDDYEASGMGWVKRRREERARKEREEKEAQEKGSRTSETSAPKIVVHSSEQEHDLRTVSVPHHHHSRHPSRSNSASGSNGSVPTISSLKKSSPLANSHIYSNEAKDLKRSDSSSSSGSSSSSSRRNDDDDDDEEEIQDESRVTSRCAGNEKISRHHRV